MDKRRRFRQHRKRATDILGMIAQRRIEEAMENGEFRNLRDSGMLLVLDEDPTIREDLRMVYKVLKNAGCISPELELRKAITCLKELVDTLDDYKERIRKIRGFEFKLMKLDMILRRPLCFGDGNDYEIRIIEKMLG